MREGKKLAAFFWTSFMAIGGLVILASFYKHRPYSVSSHLDYDEKGKLTASKEEKLVADKRFAAMLAASIPSKDTDLQFNKLEELGKQPMPPTIPDQENKDNLAIKIEADEFVDEMSLFDKKDLVGQMEEKGGLVDKGLADKGLVDQAGGNDLVNKKDINVDKAMIEKEISPNNEQSLQIQKADLGPEQELYDGSLAPKFESSIVNDYDDLLFFTMIPSLSTSFDLEVLRSLVGSIHMLRQGRHYVPRIMVFTGTLLKNITDQVMEETSWWNRVSLLNIQQFLSLPLEPLKFDAATEEQIRLYLFSALLPEYGHAIWIKFGYVYEPQRIPIYRAEKAGSIPDLVAAYQQGRTSMTNLYEQAKKTGYIAIKQGTRVETSNALLVTNKNSAAFVEGGITLTAGQVIFEAVHRDQGMEIIKNKLDCSLNLAKDCKKVEANDTTNLPLLDSSQIGIYPMDPSSQSSCIIDIKEGSFKSTLLEEIVAETPLTSSFLSLQKSPNDIKKIALALPTTSKGLSLDDTPVFLSILLPTFLNTVTEEEWNKHIFIIYVGYDHGDSFFESTTKRAEIIQQASLLIKDRPVQVKLLSLPNMRRVALLWNLLYLHALRDGAQYFYQVNDDVSMITTGWLTYFTETLDSNQGFGVVGPADYNNKLNCTILTQAMITPVHYEIFGSLYPLELKDWKTDRWLTYIYQPDHTHCRQDVIANNGGSPTRYKHCEFLSYVIYVEGAKRRIEEWKKTKTAMTTL